MSPAIEFVAIFASLNPRMFQPQIEFIVSPPLGDVPTQKGSLPEGFLRSVTPQLRLATADWRARKSLRW